MLRRKAKTALKAKTSKEGKRKMLQRDSVRGRIGRKTIKTVRRFRRTFEKMNAEFKLHRHKIRHFEPHVNLSFERGNFLIKTAENGTELEQALRLRFEVFHKEFMRKRRTYGVDIDKLDFVCDHLLIIDKRIGKPIGTYRMNCSRFNDTFYSAGEFEIKELLDLPGHKLELGRACIHKDYRNGSVMGLLWQGVAEYTFETKSKYMFGCTSIKTTDKFESAMIYTWLRDQGHMTEEFSILPTKKFRFAHFQACVDEIDEAGAKYNKEKIGETIPTLVHSYIRAGAKICGQPALDREFACIDFLTLLKVEDMSAKFARKYTR